MKVFVHGNPETSAIWGPLTAQLAAQGIDDVVTLSPPGFGAPVPDGWTATRREYLDWLTGELQAIEGPIDLVGHDWGAGHVYGFLAERPDLVRSWAADCAGLIHPDYVWHDAAQAWQTPDVGEQAIAGMMGMSDADKAAFLTAMGFDAATAAEVAAGMDDTMGRCVLGLYRDAAQPAMRILGEQLSEADLPPGLVVVATGDPYAGTDEQRTEVAARLGATTVTLDGAGHWWMLENPANSATVLAEFWTRVAR